MYGFQAGGMHPTGVLSCLLHNFEISFQMSIQNVILNVILNGISNNDI